MAAQWLGERHGVDSLLTAAQAIQNTVDQVFRQGKARPADIGGKDGTGAITQAVIEALK